MRIMRSVHEYTSENRLQVHCLYKLEKRTIHLWKYNSNLYRIMKDIFFKELDQNIFI